VYQCCGSESGIRCLFDLWIRDPGWVKKIRIRIWDKQSGSYFREFRNHFLGLKYLNFFDADPGFGIWDGKNSDPGWKKLGSGINIPDPQHCII
jgi:hypothetical protein